MCITCAMASVPFSGSSVSRPRRLKGNLSLDFIRLRLATPPPQLPDGRACKVLSLMMLPVKP